MISNAVLCQLCAKVEPVSHSLQALCPPPPDYCPDSCVSALTRPRLPCAALRPVGCPRSRRAWPWPGCIKLFEGAKSVSGLADPSTPGSHSAKFPERRLRRLRGVGVRPGRPGRQASAAGGLRGRSVRGGLCAPEPQRPPWEGAGAKIDPPVSTSVVLVCPFAPFRTAPSLGSPFTRKVME